MKDVGFLVERLVEAGLSVGEASSIIAEAVAAGAASAAVPSKSPGAARTERWRENKRHKASLNVTERHTDEPSPNVTNRHQTSQCDAPSISLNSNKKEKKDRGSQLADAWRPDEVRWTAACRKLGNDGAERELSKFTSHHRAKGTVFKNWNFAWDKWLLNAADWGPKQAAGVGVVDPEGVNWRAALQSYKHFGNWPKGHGNDPTSPACRAPPELLREFGLELRRMA